MLRLNTSLGLFAHAYSAMISQMNCASLISGIDRAEVSTRARSSDKFGVVKLPVGYSRKVLRSFAVPVISAQGTRPYKTVFVTDNVKVKRFCLIIETVVNFLAA